MSRPRDGREDRREGQGSSEGGPSEEGLGVRTVRGVGWALVATASSRLAWLAALAVLARLLSPEQFGLFAFGLVFLTYVETVGDLGTGAALIHWPSRSPEETDRAARVTFAANLVMGLVWFLLAQAVAPWVAEFFHQPERGEPILRILAASFLIKGLGITHDSLCQKELRFKERLVPEAALAVGKATTAVLLAFGGLGVWSLVWGQLLGLALHTAALWLVVPWRPSGLLRPREEMGAPELRELGGRMLVYGRGIVAVNVLAAVVHHADLVVVGRMLGATALGLYQMATKMPEVTVTLVLWVVSRVLFPAFSKLHAGGRAVGPAYLEALRHVAALTLPTAAGLFLVARPLVATLFGEDWLAAAPILRALAVYVGLRSLGSHAGDVLKATGRSGLLAGLAVVKAALLVPALVLAGRVDAVAVAWTLAGVTLATVLINLAVVVRIADVRPLELLAAIRPGALATAGMMAVVILWQVTVGGPGPLLGLALPVVLGVLSYAAALTLADRPLVTGAVARLRQAAGRGGGPRGDAAVEEGA